MSLQQAAQGGAEVAEVDNLRDVGAGAKTTSSSNGAAPTHSPSPALLDTTAPKSLELPPYSARSAAEKWSIVVLASIGAMFSSLTANVFYPAIPQIAQYLDVSTQKVNLSITWYVLSRATVEFDDFDFRIYNI
jgi:hypothetical protein